MFALGMFTFFIWSGHRSLSAASILSEFLKKLFPAIEAWMSQDAEKGEEFLSRDPRKAWPRRTRYRVAERRKYSLRMASLRGRLSEGQKSYRAPQYTNRDIIWEMLSRVRQIQRTIFGRYEPKEEVMRRGHDDYQAPVMASMGEITKLLKDPDSYELPTLPRPYRRR